jgi:hypothetical protein
MKYTINYEVPAETRGQAIIKASELLRHGVVVEKIGEVKPTVPGWYEVPFEVYEPEQLDPITAAKAEADR